MKWIKIPYADFFYICDRDGRRPVGKVYDAGIADSIINASNSYKELFDAAKLACEVWPDQMRGSILEKVLAKSRSTKEEPKV